jgi:hypothetical protein
MTLNLSIIVAAGAQSPSVLLPVNFIDLFAEDQ